MSGQVRKAVIKENHKDHTQKAKENRGQLFFYKKVGITIIQGNIGPGGAVNRQQPHGNEEQDYK